MARRRDLVWRGTMIFLFVVGLLGVIDRTGWNRVMAMAALMLALNELFEPRKEADNA